MAGAGTRKVAGSLSSGNHVMQNLDNTNLQMCVHTRSAHNRASKGRRNETMVAAHVSPPILETNHIALMW